MFLKHLQSGGKEWWKQNAYYNAGRGIHSERIEEDSQFVSLPELPFSRRTEQEERTLQDKGTTRAKTERQE